MNLLTINSYDCSLEVSGGVNRITALLAEQFAKHDITCYLGFFERLPDHVSLFPFAGRIQLNRAFDAQAFEAFLLEHKIDIVQVNFLKKENLPTIRHIYAIAHRHGIRVIYAFHMCPGFQSVTYGSWEMVRYAWTHRVRALAETKKWLMTVFRPILLPVSHLLLHSKYRIPYDHCDKLVVLSQYYVEPYCKLSKVESPAKGLKSKAKFAYIGNAQRYSSYITEEEMAAKEKIVLVVARFDEDTKRISLALKCWQQIEQNPALNDWKLVLVGDGRDRGFYEYLVEKKQLQRVEFTGLINPIEQYKRASLFLMMSSAEGWPMVLTEAAQMGVATIAMDSFGSLHDLVQHEENGLIVKNEDTEAMTQAMARLMLDDQLRKQLCREAVERSRKYEIEVIVKKWLRLFEEV